MNSETPSWFLHLVCLINNPRAPPLHLEDGKWNPDASLRRCSQMNRFKQAIFLMWPLYLAHLSSNMSHGHHLLKTDILEMDLQDDEDELLRSLFPKNSMRRTPCRPLNKNKFGSLKKFSKKIINNLSGQQIV